MLDGAIIIPLQSLFWNLLFELGALLWVVGRALLNVGYFIMVLTGWVSQNIFAPLLDAVNNQLGLLVGPLFVIAMTVLGFTYMLAVFGRFNVVSMRSAVSWLLFAAALYSFGPAMYLGMEDFRRIAGSGFYEAGITAFTGAGTATGLGAIGTTSDDIIAVPTDQFGQFLPSVPGASAVDGLDVAMAYVQATGFDALAASGSPHPIARVPYSMVEADGDGFFDPAQGPPVFHTIPDEERQASIGRAIQGVWRLFTVIFIIIFGIIEQLVHFLMSLSFAIAFFSMFVAVMFGFFIRTEPIAWGAFNLIIELFIHSIINSLLMSLVLGFVMLGANTANAILLLGSSVVGLWMSWNLLQSVIAGVMNTTASLYKSFSSATGGNIVTVEATNKSMGSASVGAMTGASVMMGGGTMLQAMGATFGDARTAQTMNYASRMLGGEETALGRMAQGMGEGASARSLAGPMGGYMLGQQNRQQNLDNARREERMAYVGQSDQQREQAIARYRMTDDLDDMAGTFTPTEAQQVRALADTYDENDFDEVVRAVQRVRNDNPGISPQSPNFLGQVREELPSPLHEMEAPALESFATLFGRNADPSAFQRALTAANTPILGDADRERDRAVSDYRVGNANRLQDAFSPDDANRLAQLIDAYDDDDFAEVVYAVRAVREAQPDAEPASRKALQETRANLPARLQNMPTRDLSVLSRAFGTARNRPTDATLPYVGQADERRDAALQAYRAGDETALEGTFNRQQEADIMVLANEYQQDDFDAIVRAVRQARTLDPDLEPATVSAVRATRRQLPERLRQIPANDLLGFSRAFGEPANQPNIGNPSGASRRAVRRREFADRLNNQQQTDSMRADSVPADATPVALNALPPAPDIYKTPDVPPIFATPAEHAVGFDQPRITPLNQLPDIKAPQQIRLQNMGIDSVEKLAETPPMIIARTAKISEEDAQTWRDNARERVQNQQQTRQQALEAMQASQNTQASQPLQPSQTSQATRASQPSQSSQPSQAVQSTQTSQTAKMSQPSQNAQASQIPTTAQASRIPTTAQASQTMQTLQVSQNVQPSQASQIPTTAQASQIRTTAQASQIPTTAQASQIRTTAQASRIPTTAKVSQNAQNTQPTQTMSAPQAMNFVSSSSDEEPPISVPDMVASSQQPPDEDANQDADGDAT
jgi:hypothetical protein